MLTLTACTGDAHAADLGAPLPAGVVWLDLLAPSPDEIAFAERVTGLRMPTRESLLEIERSSRVYTDHGAFYLSTPILYPIDGAQPRATPLGFVLSKAVLVTLRYEPLHAFDDARAQLARESGALVGPMAPFVVILEAIVDRVADGLEQVGGALDEVSQKVFSDVGVARRPREQNERLREVLQRIGHAGDVASNVRDSLLGLRRIVTYVINQAGERLGPARERLEVVRDDVASLDDYKQHLSDKTQFLLDATLGFTNIDQNNIFRILTVVSVVAVPPTLMAGVYGMNFKNMPEYNWDYGYQYGWAVILLSGLLPLLWFKRRGWL